MLDFQYKQTTREHVMISSDLSRKLYGSHILWDNVKVGMAIRYVTSVQESATDEGLVIWYSGPRVVRGVEKFDNGSMIVLWETDGDESLTSSLLLTGHMMETMPLRMV